jgi:cytochrome c2
MVGPPLDQVAQKLSPTYASSFIADPQRIRPGTAMPSFFSAQIERGAPIFTVAKIRKQRTEQTQDLLDFLWSLNAITQPKPNPELANAQTGKEIFNQIGCLACHQAEEKLIEGNSNFSPSLIGPDLSQAGARLSPTWIQHWLASPQSYFPETRMPNFRLHSDEQLALTAYLHSLGVSFNARPALPYRPNRQRSNRGRVLAEKLGCGGCHSINVLKNAPVAGPELDGFGEKSLGQLDWGHAAIPVPQRSTWRWMELKLTQPLIFDRHPGILVMPWQFLRPGELEGIILVLRSLYKNEVAASNVAQPQNNEYRQRRGEQWIGEFHCRQCHRVNDRGGAIAARYEYAWDQPPNLNGQGQKVRPGWMYNFISQPTALRPWLQLRMPTPAMKGSQREAIVAYFAALDKASYPFVHQPIPPLKGERLNQAQQLFQKFQCIRCHLLSNAGKLQPGELAPDLALSRERLRREWIYQFIIDPQKIMPGTRMPTFFLLVDEDDPKSRMTPLPQFFQGHIEEQINALVDLNLWWSTAGSPNVDHR